jgi:hypothetical protein
MFTVKHPVSQIAEPCDGVSAISHGKRKADECGCSMAHQASTKMRENDCDDHASSHAGSTTSHRNSNSLTQQNLSVPSALIVRLADV